jgi:hypothetical protein
MHNPFKICFHYLLLDDAKGLNLCKGNNSYGCNCNGGNTWTWNNNKIAAYGQTSQQQPPITSNDECLPGSVVHCIDDDEENPPNSNEDCLPGSEVICIDYDDHNNLRNLFELNIDELLQLDADDLLERFGHIIDEEAR